MLIRIEPDGRVNCLAGGEQTVRQHRAGRRRRHRRPRAQSADVLAAARWPSAAWPPTSRRCSAWIDGLGSSRRDGTRRPASTASDLTEIGINNGSLTIDDRRNGSEWKFEQISLS